MAMNPVRRALCVSGPIALVLSVIIAVSAHYGVWYLTCVGALAVTSIISGLWSEIDKLNTKQRR